MTQRRGLGKGLGALIPAGGVRVAPVPGPAQRVDESPGDPRGPVVDIPDSHEPVVVPPVAAASNGTEESQEPHSAEPFDRPADADGSHLTYLEVPVSAVKPNPRQPRQVFDDEALAELAGSISSIGLLQPVVVRPVPDGYELVAGERRLRATRLAGLETIPALVRHTDDDGMLRDALLENLHRVQLNPLEEAAAYAQLMSDFSCTQEELAQRVGRSRPQVANTLRLLKLPVPVQRRVASGVLSAGHARAILGAATPERMEALAAQVVAEGLSVRAVEEIVVLDGHDQPKPRRRSGKRSTPVEFHEAADRLADHLETRVRIEPGRSQGRIVIEFAGVEDLARILDVIQQQPPSA